MCKTCLANDTHMLVENKAIFCTHCQELVTYDGSNWVACHCWGGRDDEPEKFPMQWGVDHSFSSRPTPTVLDRSSIPDNKEQQELEVGSIIQITNEEHDWYPCLMIVEEVKSWGVQAVALIPKARKEIALAYFRIVHANFAVVGHAQIVNKLPEEEV